MARSATPRLDAARQYRFGTTSAITVILAATLFATGWGRTPLSPAEPVPPEAAAAKIPPEIAAPSRVVNIAFATAPTALAPADTPPAEPASPPQAEGLEAETTPVASKAVTEPLIPAGTQAEGLSLARIEVLHSDDRETVTGWLASGMAVLEIQTPNGMFIGTVPTGKGLINLRYTRIVGEANDPRSALRVAPLAPSLFPRAVIGNQLGMAMGVFGIDHLALVFTKTAAARLMQAQARAIAQAPDQRLDPNALWLILCIRNDIVGIASATLPTGENLAIQGECGK